MTNIALREEKVMDAFQLENIKEQLSNLLQGNDRKIESFKTKILKISLSYGMDKCTPESIISCGLQALMLDLPIDSGQGYIVNYSGKAVFDCGYKGWQVLAKRAGFSVVADVVYKCDEFSQDGFGFDKEMIFRPNLSERKGFDDNWAKANLVGVIVSILEDETGNKTHVFVESGMIFKITGVSPSQKTDKGKQFSPHENWAEQMFSAKAIKQVLSKFPIDLSKSSQLADAIEVINRTETIQQQQSNEPQFYPEDRFVENYPKWLELVQTGKKKAMSIITQLSNAYKLTSEQLEKVMELRHKEPIEGEIEDA